NEGSLVTTSRGFSQREDSYYNEYAFPWVRYGYFFEKPKVFRFLGQEEKIEKEEAEKRIKTYELEAKKYIEGRIPNINIKCPVKNDKYDIYYPNLVIRKLEKKEVTSKWI
ncbi:MAG: hypothetical protein N3D10_04395, partial [Candidatus Micrarchaeota archaeon]|nr:hypothetical protein [Candidatus Micrarchaeota archaeon]